MAAVSLGRMLSALSSNEERRARSFACSASAARCRSSAPRGACSDAAIWRDRSAGAALSPRLHAASVEGRRLRMPRRASSCAPGRSDSARPSISRAPRPAASAAAPSPSPPSPPPRRMLTARSSSTDGR